MLQTASLCCVHLSVALLYAADPARLPERWRARAGDRSPLFRLGAALGMLLAWALWARLDGPGAAALVLLVALMVNASAFVVLAPLRPRATWVSALVSPLLAASLVTAELLTHA